MTQVSLPLGASNTGSNDWADVYNNDAAIVAALNGDLRNDNVAAAAALAYSKLATMPTGAVLLGNAGTPTATTLSGDVTVGATGVTAIGATKVTNAMLAGLITDAKLLNPANGTYKNVFKAESIMSADATSGTYHLGRLYARQSPMSVDTLENGGSGSSQVVQTSNVPIHIFRFVHADYDVGSLTTKLNIRSQVATNATASTRTFAVGLYPITVAGTTDILTFTLGSVVSGSASTHTTPSASTIDAQTSGDFTIPSDGNYCLGFTLSGTLANNSGVQVAAQLRVVNV